MAYLDEVVRQLQFTPPVGADLGLPKGMAYASYYPTYEVQTPQYPTPNPYQLAQVGYRTNELVYALTNIRAEAVQQASVRVMDPAGETPEEVDNHPLLKLFRNPTPGLSQRDFWGVVETYLCIAGFSAWEKERNNKGEVIKLWPMRPDWCSFMRGEQKPIRAIRYQPYGLPPADIAIEDVVLFQYFDPLWPLLKGFGPMQAALKIVGVDNDATSLIGQFLKNGGFLSGLLKTEQTLQDTEAERIRARWRSNHGVASGAAGDIAVLGSGVEYQALTQTFSEMVFPELDARNEARIAMVFRVPPILLNAKVGLDRSTFENYDQSRKAFYEGPVTSEWTFLAGQLTAQLLPDFDGPNPANQVEFETSSVPALRENRTDQVTRATTMYDKGIATLNEAREEIGLDPRDEAEGNKLKDIKPPVTNAIPQPDGKQPSNDGQKPPQPDPQQPQDPKVDSAVLAEKKAFRKFAKQRIEHKQAHRIHEFEFKYVPEADQRKLLEEFGATSEVMLLVEAINKAANG